MLEILNNDKESNLNNTNSFKSPPPSFYNLYNPYRLRSTQAAQTTMSDINTNKCLSI